MGPHETIRRLLCCLSPHGTCGHPRFYILLTIPLIAILTSADAQTLRIGILRSAPPVMVRIIGPCLTVTESGRSARLTSSGISILAESGDLVCNRGACRTRTRSISIRPSSAYGSVGLSADRGRTRFYRGWLSIRPVSGKLLIINHIDIECYLKSVLPSEMPCDWPTSALAAQAVVARSFAIAGKFRHAREGFDMCDLTHCQVYRGASWERARADYAVGMTRGRVLVYGGQCVPAPFHSTCGGHTTDSLYTGSRTAYLQPTKDCPAASRQSRAYCAGSPHAHWSCTLTSDQLSPVLSSLGIHTSYPVIKAASMDSSGRVSTLRVSNTEISAYEFMLTAGRTLGWHTIKSTLFTVRMDTGRYVFSGHGLGHGMGLCQWGARGMAQRGVRYDEILRHYFPRCRLSQPSHIQH